MVSGDVKSNPGPRASGRSVDVLYANIRGLHANLRELTVASSRSDVLILSETLVSDRRHLSELRIPEFVGPHQKLVGCTPGARGMALFIREGCRAYRQSKLECRCHESMVVRVCGAVHNFYVIGLYRNPGHDDSIWDCFLETMARVQEEDRKAAFVYVGDANAHHTDWLESISPTDRHGQNARDFCNLAGAEQLVEGPTHMAGNRLDLVMTNVPDVVKIWVGSPIGSSDHSYVACRLLVEQSVQEHCIRRRVRLKNRVNMLL